MHILEKTISAKIVKFINGEINAFAYKRLASANNTGMPDITGCYKGIRLEIEVKNPVLDRGSIENNLSLASKQQQYYIKKYQSLGCISAVITSIDQLKELFSKY